MHEEQTAEELLAKQDKIILSQKEEIAKLRESLDFAERWSYDNDSLISDLIKVQIALDAEITNNIKLSESYDQVLSQSVNATHDLHYWQECAKKLFAVLPSMPEVKDEDLQAYKEAVALFYNTNGYAVLL